jgi:iron complex transport system ATP-binding protein
MLSIRDLCVSYGDRPVLRDLSLEVQQGELLALIGPNGAGKSTLVRAVSGVVPAVSGQVWMDGTDLLSVSETARARLIGVVPQGASLPPAFTVWETVLLGRTPYLNFLGQISARDEEIARCALEKADVLAFSERRVGELSGGEQQRVLLARALAQSTPVLLLDEPTSHLDLQHQVGLLELVHRLTREEKLTVLIAVHDLNLAARYADRVALMVAGEIKALGTPKEVLRPELISQAYQWPVQVIPHPFLNNTPLILPDVK